jgi:hypothetical protein
LISVQYRAPVMPRLAESETQCCPFIEHDDARCAPHFTLGRLSEAFDICVNRHRGCPTYYRLLREQSLVTNLTLNGQPFAAHRGLRPTGT